MAKVKKKKKPGLAFGKALARLPFLLSGGLPQKSSNSSVPSPGGSSADLKAPMSVISPPSPVTDLASSKPDGPKVKVSDKIQESSVVVGPSFDPVSLADSLPANRVPSHGSSPVEPLPADNAPSAGPSPQENPPVPPPKLSNIIQRSAQLEELGTPSTHISGAPFVLIPDENIDEAKEEFKEFIFARFRGDIPSKGRIIGILNAIWARSGPRIIVHKVGEGHGILCLSC